MDLLLKRAGFFYMNTLLENKKGQIISLCEKLNVEKLWCLDR